MNTLNKNGLKVRAEILAVAVTSKDTAFIDCLKDPKNLSTFNALCDMLGGRK